MASSEHALKNEEIVTLNQKQIFDIEDLVKLISIADSSSTIEISLSKIGKLISARKKDL